MEEESHLEIGCPEIVVDLSLRRFVQLESGLCLHDEFVIDDDIQSLDTKFDTVMVHARGTCSIALIRPESSVVTDASGRTFT